MIILNYIPAPILSSMYISIVLIIITLKIGRDMGIFILRICVNILVKVKNAPMGINVLILIRELNNFISTRLIRRNFVRITQLTSKSVNMGISVHLLIIKIRLGSNLYTIMSLMKISTCFIIKLSFVHLIWQNMIKLYVSMLIIYKTIEEIPLIISMNQFHVLTGNLKITSIIMI